VSGSEFSRAAAAARVGGNFGSDFHLLLDLKLGYTRVSENMKHLASASLSSEQRIFHRRRRCCFFILNLSLFSSSYFLSQEEQTERGSCDNEEKPNSVAS
jgi:hypothetical protein